MVQVDNRFGNVRYFNALYTKMLTRLAIGEAVKWKTTFYLRRLVSVKFTNDFILSYYI